MNSRMGSCSKTQHKEKQIICHYRRQGNRMGLFSSKPLMVIFGCLPELPGATENITLVSFRLIASPCVGPKFEEWLTARYIASSSQSLAHSHSGLVCPKDVYGNQPPSEPKQHWREAIHPSLGVHSFLPARLLATSAQNKACWWPCLTCVCVQRQFRLDAVYSDSAS